MYFYKKGVLKRFIEGLKQTPNINTLFMVFICSILIASFLITIAEKNSENSNIKTFSDGFWWSLVTVSTVGYGDLYPVTTHGKIIGGFLIFIGYSLFLILVTDIGFLLREKMGGKNNMEEKRMEVLIKRFEELSKKVDGIEERIKSVKKAYI